MELIGNLRLLQQAYFYIKHDCVLDRLASIYFPAGKISFCNTIQIGRLRLCTRTDAENKLADDSNIIMFILNGNEYPGRIRSVCTIDDGEPFLIVGYLSNLTPFSCKMDGNKIFHYNTNIKRSADRDWLFVPISMKDFVDKIVFHTDEDGVCHFLRFPTLEHLLIEDPINIIAVELSIFAFR